MEKEKMLPILLIIILTIFGISIYVRNIANNKRFEKLVVIYNNSTDEYDKIKVDDSIVVNNTSFWVVSVAKDRIVLNSSEELTENEKPTNEFELKLGEENKVCFKDESCILFKIV